jgi:hypothetical protein
MDEQPVTGGEAEDPPRAVDFSGGITLPPLGVLFGQEGPHGE